MRPGVGGLGQVPARLAPERTVQTICGFCSTGCSLDVHLRDGKPVNITPTADYPVNLGAACPKGWEALTPLAADDRADPPAAAATTAAASARSAGTTPSAPSSAASGPSRPSTAPSRSPTSAPDRSRPRRWRCSAPSPSSAWAWSTATATPASAWPRRSSPTRRRSASTPRPTRTPTSRSRTSSSCSAPTSASPTRSCGSGCCRNPHDPRIVVVDPRKTETAMAATQHVALQPKSDLVLLYGLANLLIERGWIDRVVHRRVDRPASRSSPPTSPSYDLASVADADGRRRRRARAAGADHPRRRAASRSGGRWA